MLEEIQAKFTAQITEGREQGNETLLAAEAAVLPEVARFIKEAGFTYPADITAVDDSERLQVLYRIFSVEKKQYVVIKVTAPRKGGRVPTVSDIWRGAEWFEREIFDLFGVTFEGHPDLRRILMPPDAEGHPLLKS